MKTLLRLMLLSLVCSVLVQCQGEEPLPPSIVLITVDTLRADHLGCYGYFRDTSPTIDALAADGILFERTYAPMSTTLPSHISLLTSLNPLQHGVLGNFLHLKTALSTSERLHTAPQLLTDRGYTTAGFVSAAPLMTHSGIAVGFDVYDQPERSLRNAEQTTDAVLDWLASNDTTPVFLWVHYFDPHQPYRPPPEYEDMFQTDEALLAFLRARQAPHSQLILESNNHYDGSIRYLDDQIKRLLTDLKARGLYDDAAVVFTADHGEGLGEHGWLDHGPIYDEDLHVPLIMKLPQAINQPGKRRQELAALIDVLPTLTEALDLPITEDERMQHSGIDLLGDGPERSYVFSQRVVRKRRWGDGLKYSLTGRRWKYFHLTEGADELYDLRDDPAESRNVIAENPGVAAEMERVLLDTIQAYELTGRDEGEEADLSPELIEALEALGYVR